MGFLIPFLFKMVFILMIYKLCFPISFLITLIKIFLSNLFIAPFLVSIFYFPVIKLKTLSFFLYKSRAKFSLSLKLFQNKI